MHEDRAYEANAEYTDVDREGDAEPLTWSHHDSWNDKQWSLQKCDKQRIGESLIDFIVFKA